MKNRITSILLSVATLLTAIMLSGCEWSSFASAFRDDDGVSDDTQNGNGNGNDGTNTENPALTPNTPLFYNRYTGLACDESLSSCRPISISLSNFDQKTQEGLSFADILIETPMDGDVTRLWAITTNWASISKIQNISNVKSYMMPMVNAFGAISAYAGTLGSGSFSNMDTLDYLSGTLNENFSQEMNGNLSATGTGLLNAAIKKGYTMQDTGVTLPYALASVDAPYVPSGNRISSIHFSYSQKNTVSFSYDTEKQVYLKSQLGEAHKDPLTGEQLSFANVIILFYNVSYYQTESGTTFTLDTSAGGSGFCYTGGGMVPVKWSYDNVGNLVFKNEYDEILTLNRGKSYIGLMKISDSITVVAK